MHFGGLLPFFIYLYFIYYIELHFLFGTKNNLIYHSIKLIDTDKIFYIE